MDKESAKQASGMHTATGKKTRKAKKKWDHSEIKPTDNKGHIVTHHFTRGTEPMQTPESVTHAFGEGPETVAHLMDHMGVDKAAMLAHLQGETQKSQPKRPHSQVEEADDADAAHELAESEPA
jgi:hypothetical protein